MSRLPLNTLNAFRTVGELQNLRAAAEVLHLTHSAVSQQIRGLEEQLGFALFERQGRRVVLNPAGEALLRSVQAALSQLEDGVQAAAAASSGNAQRIRMTVLPSFAQRWLLPRMGRWRERHPDLALEIDASAQLVDLQRDGFHVGVRVGRGPWPGLESERLFDSPIPLIVVGSPTAARRLLGAQPEMLAREPLLDEADLWERWFALRASRPKSRPSPSSTMPACCCRLRSRASVSHCVASCWLRTRYAKGGSSGSHLSRSPTSMRTLTISCIRLHCANGRPSSPCVNGCVTSSISR
jgi:LysR family glycine cleavage system transcriptional activator